MRDIAVVAFAQSRCEAANRRDDMSDILAPVLKEAIERAGIARDDVDFFCSGSHDFYEGRTFAYIESLDTVGAWPPISESHVEMDAAWAVHEAWVWLQLGEGDIAVVYGIGRGSLSADVDQIAPTQLDPYYLTPLRPHRHALAGLQAAALVDNGMTTEAAMAEVASQALAAAKDNPFAMRSGDHGIDELMAQPYVAAPLRDHDTAPIGDAAAAMVLAAGDAARRLCRRPAWVRGIDHRIDSHYPGNRDLTDFTTITRAGTGAAALAGFGAADIDVAELHTEYSYQQQALCRALGIPATASINPSGGPLAGHAPMATGLIRIGEVASRISAGAADRGLAHAANGQALQQNLVCMLEGDS